ncbi:MAG: hypothetical protein AAGJ51_08535 [Pseudomonadota bacterium]
MRKLLAVTVALGAFASTSCTTTEKVSVQQPGDTRLSCAELEEEFANLDAVMEDAEGDRGVNTANVAAAVFFWPAAVGNYMNAKDAEELVEKRRSHLMEVYTDKGCDAVE